MIWYILSFVGIMLTLRLLWKRPTQEAWFDNIILGLISGLIFLLGFAICTLCSTIEMDKIVAQPQVYDQYQKVETLSYDDFSYGIGDSDIPYLIVETIEGDETVITKIPAKHCRILKGEPRIEKYQPLDLSEWTFLHHLEYPTLYKFYVES